MNTLVHNSYGNSIGVGVVPSRLNSTKTIPNMRTILYTMYLGDLRPGATSIFG
jgi:hypothetical protein